MAALEQWGPLEEQLQDMDDAPECHITADPEDLLKSKAKFSQNSEFERSERRARAT